MKKTNPEHVVTEQGGRDGKMKFQIIEGGGWKSKREADQATAGWTMSLASFLTFGCLVSALFTVVDSVHFVWWGLATLLLGFASARLWRATANSAPAPKSGIEPPRADTQSGGQSNEQSDRQLPK